MSLTTGQLIRFGFTNTQAVASTLENNPQLTDILPLLADVADPDLAITQLARLFTIDTRTVPPENLRRLLMLLGGSRPLGDFIIANPQMSLGIPETSPNPKQDLFDVIHADSQSERPIAALGSDGTITEPINALRRKYRELLTRIATDDLSSAHPLEEVPQASRALATLAEAALEAALAIARALHDPEGRVDLAVLTLGKAGAKELNYISDVDVMFLTSDGDNDSLRDAGQLAVALTSICSSPGAEPALWTLDAGLRPEGRDGALVRTLESALDYYRRWAENWEFQALLKANPAAGDKSIAIDFLAEVEPLIWSAANRPGFVHGVQTMRTQVERSVRLTDRGRELKLSAGGLRDIEFTMQLLQLVHGQTNKEVRIANTLDAIAALAKAGFIARDHAEEMSYGYRFLRLLEHRVQLQGMRRTHTLPASETAVRALARSIDRQEFPNAQSLETYLASLRKRVRALHEDVYYRPIVAATASLGAGQSALKSHEAEERLRTIGYIDPAGAFRAIEALTTGTSRRAMIQRNLAPVILQWLSEGADPDLGIQSFRILSEQIGGSHWYLTLLRDSGMAARRLCHTLSNSRWAQSAFSSIPRAISWLDSDQHLTPRLKSDLADEARAIIGRYDQPEPALRRVASIVTREVIRAGLSDCTAGVSAWRPSIADAIDVCVSSALHLALREREQKAGRAEVRMCVVGMGRYGGQESSFASDVDLMFVHESLSGISQHDATAAANSVANRVRELLGDFRQQAMTSVDLDLRPEGKRGPASRSLESYRAYYNQWSSTWERQALVRARVVAGNEELGVSFEELINKVRWGSGLSPQEVRDIRLLKARMERERLPRSSDPGRHVKLGPGGLSDVEWTVQLLQLCHAHDHASLRVGSTLPAIDALTGEGYLSVSQAQDLTRAWKRASRVRAANVLATDRLQRERVDTIPGAQHGGRLIANLLGYGPGGEGDLIEQWMYASRRARAVMDECFWN